MNPEKSGPAIPGKDTNVVMVRNFSPKFHECRPGGKMHIHALVRRLQEAATGHADILGCGYGDLIAMECYWVLSNIRIRFYDHPAYLSRCSIKTWPSGMNRLLAEREFVVWDDSAKELVRASSEWLIMQGKTGRPANLLAMDLRLPQKLEKMFNTPLKRLKLPSAEMDRPLLKIMVPFSALDVNGHVNNAQYVKWAVDALHQIPSGPLTIEDLQITYLAEVFEKNEIEIFSSTHTGSGGIGLYGINRSTGKVAFHAVFVMKTDDNSW